jgi:hypothetical protein
MKGRITRSASAEVTIFEDVVAVMPATRRTAEKYDQKNLRKVTEKLKLNKIGPIFFGEHT